MFGAHRSRGSEFIQQSRGSRQLKAESSSQELTYGPHTTKQGEGTWLLKPQISPSVTHFLQQGQPPITPTPIATYWGSVFKCTQLVGVTSFKPYLCTRNRIFCCGTFHVEYHNSPQQSSKHCGFGVFKLEIPNCISTTS